MDDPLDLLTLQQVLERLKGRIGRTSLLQHMRATPVFAGGPTYRMIGSKYLFTAADLTRLMDSLVPETPALPVTGDYASASSPRGYCGHGARTGGMSADAMYAKALALTAGSKRGRSIRTEVAARAANAASKRGSKGKST